MHHQLLRRLVLLRHHPRLVPVRPHEDRHARSLRQQHRLVAMPGRIVERLHPRRNLRASLIPSRQNPHRIPAMPKDPRQHQHHRRLARATRRDAPHADHRTSPADSASATPTETIAASPPAPPHTTEPAAAATVCVHSSLRSPISPAAAPSAPVPFAPSLPPVPRTPRARAPRLPVLSRDPSANRSAPVSNSSRFRTITNPIRRPHSLHHLAKVLIRRPHHHRHPKLRRFQRIVPALRHQASPHERHSRQRVHRRQVPNRIQQQNLTAASDRPLDG